MKETKVDAKIMSEDLQLIEDVKEHHADVISAIGAIKNFKKNQRTLYRSYYLAAERLAKAVQECKDRPDDGFTYSLIKHLEEPDTSDIFYTPKITDAPKKRKVFE